MLIVLCSIEEHVLGGNIIIACGYLYFWSVYVGIQMNAILHFVHQQISHRMEE